TFDDRHYPHNLYLEYGAEMGVAGLGLFLAAVATFFVYTRRSRRALAAAGLPHHAGIATALEIAMIGYLVSSIFLHGAFQRYLWLLFALGLALDSLAARAGVREAFPVPRSPFSAARTPDLAAENGERRTENGSSVRDSSLEPGGDIPPATLEPR
ncbi:MAG TPA: hypothetical protein VGF40_00900, partial [Thermoanaerobaculia bacterium]